MQRLLVALLLVSGFAAAQTPTTANIAYASPSSLDTQKLDIYIPSSSPYSPGPYPVMMLMTGSGFSGGGRSTFNGSPWTQAMLIRGWAVAAISYRRVNPQMWPTDLNDAKAAVRFLRANAATYNLNPDAIVPWGTSGGGRLASLLATTAGISLYDGSVGPHTGTSSAVAAAVAMYAPLDFTQIAAEVAAGGCSAGYWGSTIDILGCTPDGDTYAACLDVATEASPALQAHAGSAPVLTTSGTNYCGLQVAHYRLAANLAAVGAPYSAITYTGGGHGTAHYYTYQAWQYLFRWLCAQGVPAGCTRTYQ